MNIYELKFTVLQQEILSYLFLHAGDDITANGLAKSLEVSAPGIAKSLPYLEEENLVIVSKDKASKRLSIRMNRDNPKAIGLKRAENLSLLYRCGLVDAFDIPNATVILFGSFAFGEDTGSSDIDIAVVGTKKTIDVTRFEKLLSRTITVQYYPSFKDINKHLKESLCNGILLKGGIML